MTALVWDSIAERTYETGVSQGVLYPSGGIGVVWNGLKTVTEQYEGADPEPLYYDGVKYFDSIGNKDFKATITAVNAPVEFGPCIGESVVRPGFIVTRQPPQTFGLCYRTEISDAGYKLHLIYDATAILNSRTFDSLSKKGATVDMELDITAVPTPSEIFKPSAHYVVDSTKTSSDALDSLLITLYGSPVTNPTMPTVTDLITFLTS